MQGSSHRSIWFNEVLGIAQPASLTAIYDALDVHARDEGRTEFVGTLVERASARSPLALIFEDLHLADSATLDLIAALTTVASEHRVVLLLSSRLEGDPMDKGWRANSGAVSLLIIDLRPLRKMEMRDMAHLLGAKSDQDIEKFAGRAEGNPLFLEQLILASQMPEQESVPSSIQSLVLSRVDRLTAKDQKAIRAASVLGQRFSLPVLRALLEEPGYDCAALLNENLVRRIGSEFLFAHALIWESTYLSLVSEDKRRWHARAAEGHVATDPVLAAEHFDRAGDARAPHAYLVASREEKRRYRFDHALKLFDRGLELAVDPRERFLLLCERGELLPDLGRSAEAIHNFEKARELAINARERCRALIGIAASMRMADQSQSALSVLGEAEQYAQGPDSELEAAQIHYLRGSLYFPLGNIEGCLEEHRQMLALARKAGSTELEIKALSGLGDTYYAGSRPVSSYRYFEQCVSLSREHNLPIVEASNLAMLGFIRALFLMRPQEGLSLSMQVLELAIKVGQRRTQVIANQACALSLLEMGDPSQAHPYAQTAVDAAKAIGAKRFVPEGMLFVAMCLAQTGDREEATKLLREAWDLNQDMVSYFGPAILGYLAQYTDDPKEAQRCMDQADRIIELGCPAHNHALFYGQAIDLSLQRRDWDSAERYATLLERTFSEEAVPLSVFLVERGRLLAAAGRGVPNAGLKTRLEDVADRAKEARAYCWLPEVEQAVAAL
jgi:tetratricopeptide (TPR) repeat protein